MLPIDPTQPFDTGRWHIVRHFRQETISVEWRIRRFHRRAGEAAVVDRTLRIGPKSEPAYGIEDGWPNTEFAWIAVRINGKRVHLSSKTYDDCFNARGWGPIGGWKDPDYFSWMIRRRDGATDITTKLGAHGSRCWVTWSFVHGHYASRKISNYAWGVNYAHVEG